MTEILRYAAFTSDPSGGNPAGVVLDADDLAGAQMQEIAAEVGYSETAFVLDGSGRGPRRTLRFFSPLDEVAFCGHATIATAVAIAEREGPGRLLFDTRAGEIEVLTAHAGGALRAGLRSVPTHSRPAPATALDQALEALHWSRSDLADEFPPHVAFAGNDHLVLATRTRARLADLAYDFEALGDVMAREGWTTLQLFWQEDQDTVHARDPFPVGGVVEDPATGAAAAALGGYFIELGLVDRPRSFTIVQGEDMGRRSELLVTVEPDDRRVTVSGNAVSLDPAVP